MGISSCISSKKSSQRLKNQYSQYPEDIELYKSQPKGSLNKIKFNALLSNIRIFNYPKTGVSLKFQIDGITQVLLPRKNRAVDSNEIKWVSKQKFQFIVDQYELRLKFLTVSINDSSGKNSICLKINLYKIATGPYHNDFSLFQKPQTRLKFDFKVSQYVEMKVQCKETFAQLNKRQYPGQSFYFTIRVLRQQKQQPFESAPSYPQTTPYSKSQKPERISQYDQCPSPIKIKGKLPPKPVITSSSFLWTADKGDMPSFKIFLQSDQIQKTILHLVIWRSQGQIQHDNINETDYGQDDVDMFCEAYTPIIKILQKDPTLKNNFNKNQKIEERLLNLQKQGLWSGGEKIGQFSMKMVVQNNIFIKQMKACTLSETGIIQSMPFFSKYLANKENKKKFQQIQKSMQIIQNTNKQLNQNYKLSSYQLQKLKDQMIDQFTRIKKYFEADLQKSFSVPQTEAQKLSLIDDQTSLLSFIQRVINYAEDDDTLTDVSWRIIVFIMKRGQFTLSNIGFPKNEQQEMSRNMTNLYKKKLKVALQYQEIQYKLLLQSLRIGYIQGREDPRQAIQMFRAYAYFRVPQYREILLKKVVRKQDMTIQWNTNITDGDIQTAPQAQNILSAQLDWENLFYRPLQIQSKSQALIKQMVQNLEGSLWLEQISKRGSTFFYFLYFLILKLSELGKRIKFIKWQYFPGYNKLIRAFLFQMKNVKVQRYPPSLIQASINLLANQRLLNILITIVFEKTNLNDCNGLMKSLDLVSRYLNYFTKNKKLLPTSFNYVYFFKALKIVLESQFSYAIVKALAIIFTNYDNFNIEFRRNLALYLMGKIFFKLFLNWSFTTRKAFYHVLILKIQRASDIFDPDSRKQFSNKHEMMNQIATRYQNCIKMVRNAYEVSKKDSSDKFRKNEKEIYKGLKRKLAIKKRKLNGQSQTNTQAKPISLFKTQTISNNFYYGNEFEKQKQNKVQQKYSIKQLTKIDNTQRTYSVKLDSNILKLSIENIRKQSAKQTIQKPFQEQEFRTKSGTTYVNINQNNEQWKDSNLKPKKLKQRRRSIYGMDQFEVKEIQKKQVQYLSMAIKQFDNLDEAIRKYYLQNNRLPICELDVEVPIDQKQIKPLSADFEQWQSNQSSDQIS